MLLTAQPTIHVVLVRSLYSRNVGSVSRAMANMGAGRLILIDPKCEYNLEARQGAAGAQKRLLEETIYKSWQEFFEKEDEAPLIAFCARSKKETDPIEFSERIRKLLQPTNEIGNHKFYFVFGPEDHGLENDDLKFVNFICHLPIFGEFKSLNLSHAVLLALYIANSEVKTFAHSNPAAEGEGQSDAAKTSNAKNADKFYFPENSIQTWLTTLGFDIKDRRTDAYKVLKRVLLSNMLSAKEYRVLEAIIQQTIRRLKGHN